MSSPEVRHSPGETPHPHDPLEDVVHKVPLVLPIAGGVLIFLLAFIAVYMA
jgi:hypothetical protein